MKDIKLNNDDFVGDFLNQLDIHLADTSKESDFSTRPDTEMLNTVDLSDPFYDNLFDDALGTQKTYNESGVDFDALFDEVFNPNYPPTADDEDIIYASEMFRADLFDDEQLASVVFDDDEEEYTFESIWQRVSQRIQEFYYGMLSRFQQSPIEKRLLVFEEANPFQNEEGEDADTTYMKEQMRRSGSKVLTQALVNMFESIPALSSTRAEIDHLLDIATSSETSLNKQQFVVQELVELLETSSEFGMRKWREPILTTLRNELHGLGPLEVLLADESIADIMVNGPKNIFIERRGRISRTNITFDDDQHVMRIIDRIMAPFARVVDEQHPTARVRLNDGSRVEIITRPASLAGPIIAIRKFSKIPITIMDLIRFGSITAEIAEFLRACVIARLNVLIIGGNGSGKNTLANVLSSFIPNDERIISIEYTAEYQLQQEHVVPLETVPPDDQGKGGMSFADLTDMAVNLRPDRLVFGELHGGEAFNVLEALQRGTDGSIMLLHATEPVDALNRLETMCYLNNSDIPTRGVREMITRAVDIVVEIQRLRDGSRKVVRVAEVGSLRDGRIQVENIFEFEQTGLDNNRIIGRIRPTGIRPQSITRIEDAGIHLPPSVFGVRRHHRNSSTINNRRAIKPKTPYPKSKKQQTSKSETPKTTSNLFSPDISELQAVWTFKTEDEIRGTPVADKEHVYVGSYDTNIWKVELATGEFVWKHPTAGGVVTTPLLDNKSGQVYFGSEDSIFYALSQQSGRSAWTHTTRGHIRSSPIIAHNHIFFGSDDGNLYALRSENGRFIWKYDSGVPIRSRPLVTNDRIIFANSGGEVIALDLSGQRQWVFKAKNTIHSSPIINFDGYIYVTSSDGYVYAINSYSGFTEWKFNAGKPLIGTPALNREGNILYFGSTNGSLYALNAEDGRELWQHETQKPIVSTPIVDSNQIYFGGTDGYLYSVNANSGKELWKTRTAAKISGSPAVTDDLIIIGSLDQTLYAFPRIAL